MAVLNKFIIGSGGGASFVPESGLVLESSSTSLSYTVPTGKILAVTTLSISTGTDNTIKINGNVILTGTSSSMYIGSNLSSSDTRNTPPFFYLPEGTTIQLTSENATNKRILGFIGVYQ